MFTERGGGVCMMFSLGGGDYECWVRDVGGS